MVTTYLQFWGTQLFLKKQLFSLHPMKISNPPVVIIPSVCIQKQMPQSYSSPNVEKLILSIFVPYQNSNQASCNPSKRFL